MTKLFIDSDIILDLLAKRNDYESAAKLFSIFNKGTIFGHTSPIVFANVHYILRKYVGKEKSIRMLRKLKKLLTILTINDEIIEKALYSNSPDFEDAIQYLCAEKHEIDFIITRNKYDYKKSVISALTATEFLRNLK